MVANRVVISVDNKKLLFCVLSTAMLLLNDTTYTGWASIIFVWHAPTKCAG